MLLYLVQFSLVWFGSEKKQLSNSPSPSAPLRWIFQFTSAVGEKTTRVGD